MNDLETLKAMLDRTKTPYVVDHLPDFTPMWRNSAIKLRVLPGYRAHFEAEFDGSGMMIDIGSYDEL